MSGQYLRCKNGTRDRKWIEAVVYRLYISMLDLKRQMHLPQYHAGIQQELVKNHFLIGLAWISSLLMIYLTKK